MDNDTLIKLIGPEGFNALLQQSQQASNPTIDVPVRVEPPPVKLHGTLQIEVTFPMWAVTGQTYDQIKQSVYDRIAGVQGPWMPTLVVGQLELWRPVSAESGAEPAVTVRREEMVDPGDSQDAGPPESADFGDSFPYEPGSR